MKSVLTIMTGMGILIGIYLLINKGDATVKIIDTIAKNSTNGIKALQGR